MDELKSPAITNSEYIASNEVQKVVSPAISNSEYQSKDVTAKLGSLGVVSEDSGRNLAMFL